MSDAGTPEGARAEALEIVTEIIRDVLAGHVAHGDHSLTFEDVKWVDRIAAAIARAAQGAQPVGAYLTDEPTDDSELQQAKRQLERLRSATPEPQARPPEGEK